MESYGAERDAFAASSAPQDEAGARSWEKSGGRGGGGGGRKKEEGEENGEEEDYFCVACGH